MKTVCVTGAGGMTGVATVLRLLADGYSVVGADLAPLPASLPPHWSVPTFQYVTCDLTDYGDTVDVLSGVDAVVHLANIPAPGLRPPARTLNVNTAMNANVFLAAAQLGLERVVWSSSETTLGLDFDAVNRPRYLPVDEEHSPYPRTTYALSKVLGETTARHVADWSGIPFVGLRLSNVIRPEAYADFPKAGPIRRSVSSTCGATSTSAMRPRRARRADGRGPGSRRVHHCQSRDHHADPHPGPDRPLLPDRRDPPRIGCPRVAALQPAGP